jgi:Glycosyltransferase family 92
MYDTFNQVTETEISIEDGLSISENHCFRHINDSESLFHNSRTFRELQHGTSLCQQVRRPVVDISTTKYWHILETSEQHLAMYSAYFDDRPALGVTSWLRIFGVTNNTNGTFYCHLWFDGCQSPYVVEASLNGMGRATGYVINEITYVQYLFSCRLPGHEPAPSHVSLVFMNQCSVSSTYLPVERPIRSEPEHEFGVCVAIAFGHVPLAEFVEWIELHRMLGVTEFNIYDAGMVNMSTVFDYYAKLGLLKVHSMPPPVLDMASLSSNVLEVIMRIF